MDMDLAYEEFEAGERQKDLDRFLEENRDVEREQLTEYISEYEFSYIIDEGRIRDNISAPMGLLKKKSLVRKIVDFIRSFVQKYQ